MRHGFAQLCKFPRAAVWGHTVAEQGGVAPVRLRSCAARGPLVAGLNMRYTLLPGTNIRVSVIAMGCWALAGDTTWGDQSESDSIDAVRAALDAGISFFDTAPGYGDGLSERRLGKGLAGQRDRAVVATKIGPDALRAPAMIASVERSLGYLDMDHVDLLQIHWPSREVPFEETWTALERLREQGKTRALGISNFGPADLAQALGVTATHATRPSTNQLPYSLLSRAIEFEIQPACARGDVGILCYSPLLWGLLADKYPTADDVPAGRARSRHFAPTRPQIRHTEAGCEAETFAALARIRRVAQRLELPMQDLAVAWLLHQPAVTAVLAGIRSVAQAEANTRAAGIELDSATLAELDAATADVKRALGPNPDLWQSGASSRYR
jgi:aryl-alcohol dehydrogenase-like predicted oxidoreductase